MNTYTKTVKLQIRDLAGLLYEQELNGELMKLDQEFGAWRGGQLSPFDLAEKIHHFHQHPARELYNHNASIDQILDLLVARGIVTGILKPEEVPPEVGEALAEKVAFYKKDINA